MLENIYMTMDIIISGISTIITALSILLNFFTYIPQFLKWLMDKRYLKHVLNSKNKYFLITQSILGPGMISKTFTKTYSLITKKSVICICKICKLLDKAKIPYQVFETNKEQFDEIHIGGPLTNINTNAYISQYFPNFYYIDKICNKQQHDKFFYIHKKLIKYSDEFNGFSIKIKNNNQPKILQFPNNKDTDYAFLIKLCSDDLGIDKTVHLILGGSDIGTLVATDFFTKNYIELYKYAKKDHYFIVIQVHKTNQSVAMPSMKDLTEQMFNSSTRQ